MALTQQVPRILNELVFYHEYYAYQFDIPFWLVRLS